MKRISLFVSFCVVLSMFVSSCGGSKTYADLVDDENKLLSEYLSRNNINVLSEFPKTWKDNDYVKTSSGLYFHLSNPGVVNLPDSLKTGDEILARYYKVTLNQKPDTFKNWSVADAPNPDEFIYGNSSESFTGFQEAVKYMKYDQAEAKIIVPSSIGEYNSKMSVTPYFYQLRIRIRK